jgi:hypothetical protein
LRNAAEQSSRSLLLIERSLVIAVPALLFTRIFLECLTPFRSNLSWMMYVLDDFFYYLKTAQNFAHGNGSTFNGIVHTNGYHPLWFLSLSMLSFFSSSPQVILGFVAFTAFLASVVTYFCALNLIRSTGIRKLTAVVLASCITLYSVRLFFYGMEVTLAIPLSLTVICLLKNTDFWLRGWRESFLMGLLFTTMILSRLDTILLAGLILVPACLQPQLRERLKAKNLIGLATGFIPLVIYFCLNHHFFQVWLPISGMAKQLKLNHHPTLKTWQGLYLTKPGFLAVFLPVPVGLLIFPCATRYLSPIQKVLYPATLLFPLAYFFALCCLSDWGIWPWYMYALRPAVCVAFVVFCTWPPLARVIENSLVTSALLAVMAGLLLTSQWRVEEADLNAAAIDIQTFARTHPGTYAMGDRAGRVGYLLDQPVIQMEGLVMDRTFLAYIQKATPLRTVLDAYHVRYYIGTTKGPYPACFQADEPIQAGPASPHMRGTFCERPVAVVTENGVENPIYDLRPEIPSNR